MKFLIILSLTFNITIAQNKQCNVNYNFINKIFNLNSIESIDSELNKYGYSFDFNSNYTNYWNEKQKSNFSIYWDSEKSNINHVNVTIDSLCYESLKSEIINLGYKKVYEKMTKYRIDLYYNKNGKFIGLGKVNSFNLEGAITNKGFEISLLTEEKYNEFINN